MANESKFTHISVSVDDDDDFVIEAGASSVSANEVQPAAMPEPEVALEPGLAPASELEVAPEPELRSASASAVQPVVAPESEVASASKPAVKGYHETTLADLEGEKMSGMQKGVIVAAVLAIIAFVVWYLVL